MYKLLLFIRNHKVVSCLITLILIAFMIGEIKKTYTTVTTQSVEIQLGYEKATIRVPKNWVMTRDNNGFLIFYDSNGKVVMEERSRYDNNSCVIENPSTPISEYCHDKLEYSLHFSNSSEWLSSISEVSGEEIGIIKLNFFCVGSCKDFIRNGAYFYLYLYEAKEIEKLKNGEEIKIASRICKSVCYITWKENDLCSEVSS